MDLSEIRARIDALDSQIIALLARRQDLVRQAGAQKRDEAAVRAPDRVDEVIVKVRALATQSALHPHVAEATYRAMIAAFIDLELSDVRGRDEGKAGPE
jgi:isochorismate pyruvate lyase